jgi:hypothetical protein
MSHQTDVFETQKKDRFRDTSKEEAPGGASLKPTGRFFFVRALTLPFRLAFFHVFRQFPTLFCFFTPS